MRKIVTAAAGVVVVGFAIAAAVVLRGEDDAQQQSASAPRQPPVRVRTPAKIDGIEYVVNNALAAPHPDAIYGPRPLTAPTLPRGNRFWVVVIVGLRNATDSTRTAIQRAPRLRGPDGEEYRADRRYSDRLLVRGLRAGFYTQRRLAFFVPRRVATEGRLQLDDCPSGSRDTQRCRRVEFELGIY